MTREAGIIDRSSIHRELVAVTPSAALNSTQRPPFTYEPALAENVVLMRVARPGPERFEFRRHYHQLAEQLYLQAPPDDRAAAFARLHRQLFIELGHERLLRDALAEFPGARDAVTEVLVTGASQARPEGADLRQRLDNNLVALTLALRPQRFLVTEELRTFLRHELRHIADMLDPAFGYVRAARLADSPRQENSVRARYRLLWDISVDGRLTRAGKATVATKSRRLEEFTKMFAQLPPGARWAMFDQLWETNCPTHAQLSTLATQVRDATTAGNEAQTRACALCEFPTYAWADSLSLQLTALILGDFPRWSSEQRICAHCAEFYEMKARANVR